ncbi:MAG: L-rhamnose mutarotase [Verrucomicrobia subdivision 3 bacterium]|nr:L-rhamnose mutarotase [Limisphaerales bacterium]
MIRKAFVIQARPGLAAEYQRRHNPIWPELAAALKQHGVSNYSIFLRADTGEMFGYLEVADETVFQKLGENDACRRWWRYMTEVLVSERADSPKAKEEMLGEIFHLD